MNLAKEFVLHAKNKLEVFGTRDRDFNFEDTTYITSLLVNGRAKITTKQFC